MSYRKGLTALVAGGLAVGCFTACTPDTTRARIENDVPTTFAHAYSLSEQLQGQPGETPEVTSTECHSSVNQKQDAGPGSWSCDLSYRVAGRKHEVSLLILVDQLGCYQGMDSDHRNRTIRDRGTGQVVPDPKVGFDGCFDVYDSRTSVDKAASPSPG